MGRFSTRRDRALSIVLLAIGLLLLCAAPAAANVTAPGGQWYWQNPTPQSNDIGAAWFVDQNRGWAVGGAGMILTTADGGATWTPQTSGVEQLLTDVAFSDATTGWIVGTGGTILHTTDGGAAWVAQTSPAAVDLWGLCVLDNVNIYAVGTGGTILHTTDGGVTPTSWVSQISPTVSEDFLAVTFRSLNNGWAVGTNGVVVRTLNGGLTWFPEVRPTGEDLNDIAFASLYEGWAVGANGTVRHTLNGGVSWDNVTPGGGEDYAEIAVLGASELWIAGTGGDVRHSLDGGADWTTADVPTGLDLFALAAVSATDVRAFGERGVVTRTVDGTTWTLLWMSVQAQNLRGVSFSGNQNGWAVGVAGTAIHTVNGGADWYRQESGTNLQLNEVDFTDALHGCAVGVRSGAGNPGTIRVTANGGLTWQAPATNPSTHSLNDVAFVSLTAGVAVGNAPGAANATIVTTVDGGTNWTAQSSALAGSNLNGVDIVPDGIGGTRAVAVGDAGSARYSINGASPWTAGTTPGGTGILRSVDMVGVLRGWAVGDGGTILTTADGGATWTAQTSNTTADLTDLSMYSSDLGVSWRGWAVGIDGTVVTTVDSGTTWVESPWMWDYDNLAMDGDGAGSAWVTGELGATLSSFNPNLLGVTGLKASPGDTKITVSWTNPAADFGGVMVYYSTLRCASSVYDTYGQQLAYEGTGSSLERTGLENMKQYYFTVFTRNVAGTWSNPQTLVVVPIPTFKVTLTLKPSAQVAGKTIKFSGKVTPAGAALGSKIYIQKFTGSWKTFATTTVKSGGSYSISKKLNRGSYKVRAYIAGSASALAGYSPARYATWK